MNISSPVTMLASMTFQQKGSLLSVKSSPLKNILCEVNYDMKNAQQRTEMETLLVSLRKAADEMEIALTAAKAYKAPKKE
jgi:hypothetical protein